MNPLYGLLIYVVWFLATYSVVLFLLVAFSNRDKLYENRVYDPSFQPKVSILVPAFNEEGHIKHTIDSLKEISYPNVEFIILNDGSSDNTSLEVRESIKGDKRFRFIDNKKNKGKAATLNQGIELSKGEFVACMDADTKVEKDIIQKVLPYFDKPEIGCVTVSIEVREHKNLLHKIIDLEFILGLSLFLKVFSFLDLIFVTPGPFSIYRKQMLTEIGAFDPTNITEDFEIAFRIRKAGYKIVNCLEAKASTLVPPTFKGLYKQRKRWYSGALLTMKQHKDIIFNKKYGAFGYFMPINYSLIALGLLLFTLSQIIGLNHTISHLSYFRYTNFNFFERITNWDFDILYFGGTSLFAMSMTLLTFFFLFIGLRYAKKTFNNRKLGVLGYPLLFILYQIFWFASIVTVIRKKKIKWR